MLAAYSKPVGQRPHCQTGSQVGFPEKFHTPKCNMLSAPPQRLGAGVIPTPHPFSSAQVFLKNECSLPEKAAAASSFSHLPLQKKNGSHNNAGIQIRSNKFWGYFQHRKASDLNSVIQLRTRRAPHPLPLPPSRPRPQGVAGWEGGRGGVSRG